MIWVLRDFPVGKDPLILSVGEEEEVSIKVPSESEHY